MVNGTEENTADIPEIEKDLDKNESNFFIRLICAILSLFIPGLGQALQQRYLRAFDLLILYGACLVGAFIFSLQLFKGPVLPIMMLTLFAVPSIVAFFDALFDKSHPGDADTIVRSIFLFIFFYILTIGPFHFLYNVVGFKIHRLPEDATQLEPIFYPGDVIVFDLDAYGIRTPGINLSGDKVNVGDIVYHKSKIKNVDGKAKEVHMVLAAPGDTLVSSNGMIMVNGQRAKMPLISRFSSKSDFGPIVVPKDELFLVDNTQEFFPVYLNSVIGKAFIILYSKEYDGDYRLDRFGKPLQKVDILFPRDSLIDTTEAELDSAKIIESILPY